MAVSGSSNYTTTRQEIIKGALRILRAYTIGESGPEPEQYQTANESLNLVLKNLAVEGMLLWTQTQAKLYLNKGQPSYNVGPSLTSDLIIPRPTRIIHDQCQVMLGDIETPVHLIGRSDYFNLTDKTAQGQPVQAYYDRQITDGVVYVWPTPDTGKYSLNFTYERVVQDFDASGDNPDFPPEWFLYLKWALAADLGMEYGTKLDRLTFITAKAKGLKKDLLDFEVEPMTQFTPDMEGERW